MVGFYRLSANHSPTHSPVLSPQSSPPLSCRYLVALAFGATDFHRLRLLLPDVLFLRGLNLSFPGIMNLEFTTTVITNQMFCSHITSSAFWVLFQFAIKLIRSAKTVSFAPTAGGSSCVESLPLNFRTRSELQTARIGLNAAWPQARFSSSAWSRAVLDVRSKKRSSPRKLGLS